jgi:hypothetical protein
VEIAPDGGHRISLSRNVDPLAVNRGQCFWALSFTTCLDLSFSHHSILHTALEPVGAMPQRGTVRKQTIKSRLIDVVEAINRQGHFLRTCEGNEEINLFG